MCFLFFLGFESANSKILQLLGGAALCLFSLCFLVVWGLLLLKCFGEWGVGWCLAFVLSLEILFVLSLCNSF